MAVAASNLTSGNSTSNGDFSTASITPAANRLILIAIYIQASAIGSITSVTGNGITYELVNSTGVPVENRVLLYRGMSASPSAGAITIARTGGSNSNIQWVVDEVSNVFTGGAANGAGAVVQSAADNTNATITSFAPTLAAFTTTANGTYACIGRNQTAPAMTAELTELVQNVVSSRRIATQYSSGNDTTPSWSFASSAVDTGSVAIEIKAANTGGGVFFM